MKSLVWIALRLIKIDRFSMKYTISIFELKTHVSSDNISLTLNKPEEKLYIWVLLRLF